MERQKPVIDLVPLNSLRRVLATARTSRPDPGQMQTERVRTIGEYVFKKTYIIDSKNALLQYQKV